MGQGPGAQAGTVAGTAQGSRAQQGSGMDRTRTSQRSAAFSDIVVTDARTSPTAAGITPPPVATPPPPPQQPAGMKAMTLPSSSYDEKAASSVKRRPGQNKAPRPPAPGKHYRAPDQHPPWIAVDHRNCRYHNEQGRRGHYLGGARVVLRHGHHQPEMVYSQQHRQRLPPQSPPLHRRQQRSYPSPQHRHPVHVPPQDHHSHPRAPFRYGLPCPNCSPPQCFNCT